MAAGVIAIIFRTYLSEHSIEQLASILKKGGIKDLLLFFPQNKREDKILDDFFKERGLAQVGSWWTKKKYGILKEEIINTIKEHKERGNTDDEVRRHFSGQYPFFLWLTARFSC